MTALAAGDIDTAALYGALDLLSTAVLCAEGGDTERAATFRMEASLAAADAFPAGSDEANALGVLLDAAARVPEMTS